MYTNNNNLQTQNGRKRVNRKRTTRLRRGTRNTNGQQLINQLWNLPSRNPNGVEMGPFPNCMDVTCKTEYFQRVTGETPFVLVEFRLNDLFLPYTGAGISASGLASAGSIYDSYKVKSVKFEVAVVSNETFVMSSGIFLRDAQPSTLITTYQLALNALANGPVVCRGTVGSTSGMSRYKRVSPVVPLTTIVGQPILYMSDRDFAALVVASPNQIVWGAFILVSDDVTQNLTNGVSLQLKMAQHSCFFSKTVNL